jgi:hypothetical protein
VYAADGTKELKYLKQAEPISAGDILNRYSQASAYVCPLDYEVPLQTVSQIARLQLMAVDLGITEAPMCAAIARSRRGSLLQTSRI